MTQQIGEQISALMDGELDAREVELLVKRLGRDDEHRDTWCRYHVIGEAMRSNLPGAMPFDLAARVSAAIANESLPAPSLARRRWLRPAAGIAVAASVAGGILLGFGPQQGVAPGVVTVASSVPVPAAVLVEPPSRVVATAAVRAVPVAAFPDAAPEPAQGRWKSREPLSSYVVSHNESATMNQMSGVLPYVRMVGYESGR